MLFQSRVAVLLGALCVTGGAQSMQHPGVLVSGQQLDFVKLQVKEKKEPIYGQYQKAVASQYGALDYSPQGPPANGVIECGPYSKPDHGCRAESEDATTAYLQAVLWWISGNHRYADNAIRIMNAYSRRLTAYTNSNAPLQAAWSAEMWPRAGEIIRYSSAGWKPEEVRAFGDMLTKIHFPLIREGSTHTGGNWELSMIEAMMGIAVFTDDRALLEHAEQMWRERVPTYFYNAKLDGGRPKLSPKAPRNSWQQSSFEASTSGMSEETCRDLSHTGYGISATIAAAETAHIQGDKLYESEEQRLIGTMEFHAHLLLRDGPVSNKVCGGEIKYGKGYTFGIGYNEYHNRLGQPMPETRKWLNRVLDEPEPVDIHTTVFEMLSHGEDAGASSP